MKATYITKALIDCIWKMFGGGAEQLVSDNTSYFLSKLFKGISFEWRIKRITTNPYYPCQNLVERVDKDVKVALSIFHSHVHWSWDENMAELNLTFNSVPHSTTGFSPSKVFLGCELPSTLLNIWGTPPETLNITDQGTLHTLWDQTYVNLQKAMRSVAKKYSQGRITKVFNCGDLVMCQQMVLSNKANYVSSNWRRPTIVRIRSHISDCTFGRYKYSLKRAHVTHLESFCARISE
ncbi:hypothetical protein PR048_018854 [Dryococelus australis]|uniref:Integrase catalytic domain-containing protein n=1 Tax=Dryococelus australis TaxID=614101 RepID=A0ABQ9H1Y6_9NEOP|nr:hypothetical protein PR048_018854 [Dryococelus australis]